MAREPYRDPSATVSATRSKSVTFDQTFEICRCLYVGTGGDLTATMAEGADQLFKNVPAGSFMPIQATMVKASGTTAADVVALF